MTRGEIEAEIIDLPAILESQVDARFHVERLLRHIDALVSVERERCAKIADARADEARAFFAAEKCSEFATGILVASGIAKEIRKPT